MLSGAPPRPVEVPAPIRRAAGDQAVTPVWLNALGGLTFQLGEGPERRFAKWAPTGSGLDLRAEAERCRWAASHLPVPAVLELGEDEDGGWLVTAGLPGENPVGERWRHQPERVALALGRGLRRLHDTLPVADCPFAWPAADRVRAAAAAGSEIAHLGPTPPVDRLVVCHGDACVPNTLLDEDGACAGYVDLGSLGVADRWADLAVAVKSLEFNHGPGWDDVFWDAYGLRPDPVRVTYYSALWEIDD